MKIYIADINNFNKKKLNEYISLHKNECIMKNHNKIMQHFLGLYLAENIAKSYYGIQNTKIEYKNSKPFFQNNNLNFSISHSDNMVAIVFSNNNIGIDIENNQKKRKFKKILQRFSKDFSALIDEDIQTFFYDFWTEYEAKIKLNPHGPKCYTEHIYSVKNFTICVAQEIPFEISEVVFPEQ